MDTVLIIGGGYAGAHAARRARRGDVHVVVVDPGGRHAFAPRYAAVAAGRAPAGDVAAPLDRVLGDVEVVAATVERIDTEARQVHLDTGVARPYDALVVTTGARAAAAPIEGMVAHGRSLDTVAQTLALRAELAAPHAVGSGGLVVVGGGATGVQVAAEVAHQRPDRTVTLVEAADRLLPGEPRSLHRGAARVLRAAGVEVRLGRGVASVDARGAVLADGARVEGTVVWAGGWEPIGHHLLPDAPTDHGRLEVDLDLSVRGTEGVFAAGDSAAHRDPLGRPLPMSAQIAAQAGAVAGQNAVTFLRGRPTKPAILVELGRVLDLGGGVGVARVGPVRLTRRPLDRLVPLVHLAIDVRHLWQIAGVDGVVAHAPGRGGELPPDGQRPEGPIATRSGWV